MTALIRYLERFRGIPESDVRSVSQRWDRDVYDVRLWNHRRLQVTGYELAGARPIVRR